jgi:hypothetical protein
MTEWSSSANINFYNLKRAKEKHSGSQKPDSTVVVRISSAHAAKLKDTGTEKNYYDWQLGRVSLSEGHKESTSSENKRNYL